ncbi:Hypp1414 [Branchiostoma lanceolatum]|uniref:Hypp1414 protein n=1 Tax=Branchiostoma lanceolatum TaxID=7740 RepID=A0A8K0EIR2_BRALA|nr:Hypp1414 [Branchiostoma lanceolatum]
MNTHILFIISLLSKEVAAIDCSQCTFPDSQDPDDVTCITSPPAATACLPNATRCEAAVSASMRGGALPIVLSFRRRCSAVQGNQGCAQAQNTQECQTTCGTDGCLPDDPTDAIRDDTCSGTAQGGGGGGGANQNTPAGGNGTQTGTGSNGGVIPESSMITITTITMVIMGSASTSTT